jgi:hypothetical protein
MAGRQVFILIFLMPSPRLELQNLAVYNTYALDRTNNVICRKKDGNFEYVLNNCIVRNVACISAPGYIDLYAADLK